MKILIVQLGSIGDMILATPMFSALKKILPDAQISVLASIPNHSIITNNPNVDQLFVWDKSPLRLLNVLRQISAEKFDLLLDAKDHYSREGSYIAKLSGASRKIGYNKKGSSVFDIVIGGQEKNSEMHYTLRCLKALSHFTYKLPASIPKPELYPSHSALDYTSTFLEKQGSRELVVINISASNKGKMWDNDKWSKFINSLNRDIYYPILTYAPIDRDDAERLLRTLDIVEFKSRSMDDVTALISKSNIVITPDTSIVHVAGAFNKPLLGLFSGLDDFYAKFHPLSDDFVVVRSPKGIDGIKSIDADEAINGFEKLISLISNK